MSVDAAHSVGPPAGFGKFGAIDRVMVGLIVFLASEVMLFGAFFTAFFYLRYQGTYPVFPPQPYDIPKTLTGINTSILVSSSFTMHWALVSVKRNNRLGLILGLFFTLGLGLTFLGIQMYEYRNIGFTPESGRVRVGVLLPDGPARRPRLPRRDPARDRARALAARSLLVRAPHGRRADRHLLALRRLRLGDPVRGRLPGGADPLRGLR